MKLFYVLILTMHSKKILGGGPAALQRNIIVTWAKYICADCDEKWKDHH